MDGDHRCTERKSKREREIDGWTGTIDAQKENESTQEEIPEVVKATTDPDSTQIKETGQVSRDTTTAQMMTNETDFDVKDYEELETIVELGNFETTEFIGVKELV
ncbi:Uncharacterized protein Adt_25700 [Abeliophyllum distichum]|uniref:Uncharacterized protein n=1 Tax=Abeliophyllum distichum TaxID=126358 RepID=A0ABD1SHG8_9LAMI